MDETAQEVVDATNKMIEEAKGAGVSPQKVRKLGNIAWHPISTASSSSGSAGLPALGPSQDATVPGEAAPAAAEGAADFGEAIDVAPQMDWNDIVAGKANFHPCPKCRKNHACKWKIFVKFFCVRGPWRRIFPPWLCFGSKSLPKVTKMESKSPQNAPSFSDFLTPKL